jgi:hypothetical protein
MKRESQPIEWLSTIQRSIGMKIALLAKSGTGTISHTATAAKSVDATDTKPKWAHTTMNIRELTDMSA